MRISIMTHMYAFITNSLYDYTHTSIHVLLFISNIRRNLVVSKYFLSYITQWLDHF
jgi:hypothetical protein